MTGCRGTLAEPLRGFGDQLCRNVLVVKQDPPLAQQGRQARRIGQILGDGLMLAVANVHEPVSHANHFLSVGRAFDQGDEVDIAMRRHGASGARSDENNAHQVAAAFRADIFDAPARASS